MKDLTGETIVFIGALETLPRRLAARLAEQRGAIVRRGLTRRTSVAVVGRAAPASLGLERLRARLDLAVARGATCWSESSFLRRAGLGAPGEDVARSLDEQVLRDRVGLPSETLRLLTLLDVVEAQDGRYGFQGVVAARTVARLLREGADLCDVIASLRRARRERRGASAVVRRDDGTMGLRLGGDVADLDGQLRLPLALPEGSIDNPSVDALFEAAEVAEDEARWDAAARLYRRCIHLDRADPIAPFNLANVLRRQDRLAEANLFLRLAVSVDPAFAEAWYNLAHVAAAQGRAAAARDALECALTADPDYGDALYNAALLHFQGGDHGGAAQLWRRYLEIDAQGEWAKKARAGLALCDRQPKPTSR